MSNLNSVTTLLSNYNVKYTMSKCLESQTLVQNNTLSSNLHNVNFSSPVQQPIVDALASIGLMKLVENDLSALAVETRLMDIIAGKFAARKAGETKEAAPSIPETIEQLPLKTIEEVVGDSLTSVKLSVKDLARFGLLSKLPAQAQATLQHTINEQRENAERVKVLFDMFKISHATIDSDTETSLTFNCQVPITLWNSVFTKIKSSVERGWSVQAGSVVLDESMTKMIFILECDKTLSESVE